MVEIAVNAQVRPMYKFEPIDENRVIEFDMANAMYDAYAQTSDAVAARDLASGQASEPDIINSGAQEPQESRFGWRTRLAGAGLAGLALASCNFNSNGKPNGGIDIGDSITAIKMWNGLLSPAYAESGLASTMAFGVPGNEILGGHGSPYKDIDAEVDAAKPFIQRPDTAFVNVEEGTNPVPGTTLYAPNEIHISTEQMEQLVIREVEKVNADKPGVLIISEDILSTRADAVVEFSGRNAGLYLAEKYLQAKGIAFHVFSWVKLALPNADPLNLQPGPDPAMIAGDQQGGVHPGSIQSAMKLTENIGQFARFWLAKMGRL